MINKVKNKLKDKDNKSLFENFLSLSALQFIGMFLPLMTLPYLLRVLGTSNYGIIVLASSLITYFNAVTDFSFRITATRDTAIFRNSTKKLSLIYSKVLIIKGVFLMLSCLIITAIIFLYEPFYQERLVFFLSMLMLVGYTLFPEWFFQGIEKMKYITFLNLGVKLFFTICVFIFINKKEDYWIYPLLQSAGFIVAAVIGQLILIKKYKLKFIWLPFRIIKQTLVENYPIFINQVLPTLYNNTSTFLLGILTNTSLVGIYDAIKKIIDLCLVLISIVSRVFFPFLSRKKDSFVKYKNLMLVLGLSLTVIPIIMSPLVFWYLNLNNNFDFTVLLIFALGIFGFTLYDIFGVNYFIIRREDKLVMSNTIKASVVGLILSFPLIHFFGIIGAALNLTFCRFLMGGLLFFKWRKYDEN